MKKQVKKLLKRVYTTPGNPASFAGVLAVLREARKSVPNLKRENVEEFLHGQDTYTKHKPLRRRFPRNRVVATGIDSHWQADLCDMKSVRKYNDGVAYLLTVIDVLSKFAWAQPTTSKTPEAVRDAFAVILAESGRQPGHLFTDKGKEFLGCFQNFLHQKAIVHAVSQNPDVKASVAERYNRTLKTRLWKYMTEKNSMRYIDDLPAIVSAINHSYHRSIKMRPVDVSMDNKNQVWETLYAASGPKHKFKFQVGDHVRITKEKHVFQKGYLPNFTEEIFVIDEQVPRSPPVYRLKDLNGDSIAGIFYEQELSKVIKREDNEFKIEKVLRRRKKHGVEEVLVKWMGYPKSFNEWIPASSIRIL